MINEHTASSAEVIAGSLQELKLAKLMGCPSFGKATVLEPFNLADGSQILLATSRILFPSGRCIQRPYHTYNKDSITNWLSPFSPLTDSFGRSAHKYVSANGLNPDYNFENENTNLELSDDMDFLLRRIILSHYQELKIAIGGKVENISNNEVNQKIDGYLANHIKPAINSLNTNQIKEQCKFILAELMFGTQAMQRLQLLSDPVFEKAKMEISAD